MNPLSLGWALARTWTKRPSTPTRIVMDVTRRCNLKCESCNTWRVTPEHELTPDEIRHVLRQLTELVWMDVTGGEIFVRRDADAIFAAILESTPSLKVFHFPTNGWFEKRVVEACVQTRRLRPDLDLIVTVSIDGPEEVHDRVRGMPGSFARALDTYRALTDLGVETYVGTTVTPFNAAHVEELGRVLDRELPHFEARRWHWNLLQVSEHFFANGHLSRLPRLKQKDLVRAHMKRRGIPKSLVEVMELLFLINLEFYERGEPSNVVCQSLHSACFISPEGDVHPCHVYDRPLGNVRDKLAKLWASKETLRARTDIEALACGGCFTPCEAYPALAGAPLQTLSQTSRRALRLVKEGFTRDALAKSR